jgi:hypothetical protein
MHYQAVGGQCESAACFNQQMIVGRCRVRDARLHGFLVLGLLHGQPTFFLEKRHQRVAAVGRNMDDDQHRNEVVGGEWSRGPGPRPPTLRSRSLRLGPPSRCPPLVDFSRPGRIRQRPEHDLRTAGFPSIQSPGSRGERASRGTGRWPDRETTDQNRSLRFDRRSAELPRRRHQ